MPKVVYTTSKGLVQQAGEGFQLEDLPFSPVQGKTAAFSAAQPGVYTVTAGGAVGVTMPLASSFPGGLFTIRNGDAFANFLTCSLEANGTKAFVLGNVTAGSVQNGSKVTLQAVAGASVAVISDGKNYIVLPGSGSIAFSGA